ncbi:uncharacterized protein LOC135482820 [Lineus longissimus]|uniref:uncharacterized protein LOC135482820 n=1 Tax=Lineus longissimus TaxID=88925 RepID=UPI00315D5F75
MTNSVSRQMQKEMLAKAYQKDAKDIKVNWSLADDAIPSVSLLPSKPKHGTPAVTERPKATRSPLTPVPGPSSDIFTTPKLTGSRNAVVIRERKRDVEAAGAWKEAMDFQAAIEADVSDDEDGGQESVPCQTKSQFTQVNRRIRRPKHRSMRVQTNYEKPKTKVTVSIGTQTDEKVYSISSIDVKPNVSSSGTPTGTDPDHLPNIATGNCPQAKSASNEMEDGPGSESSDDESLEDTVDPLDKSYEPAESDISSEEVSDEEFNFIDNENEKDDPHCQTKYLVFHSKLMELFKICPVCCSPAKRHIRTLGTYLSIKQCCSNKLCSFERFWESQPFINRIPAGNLLLSSAILFAGSTAAKTLKVFSYLGCQAIKQGTFYQHQRQYLWPAVMTVWRENQQEVLQQVKDSRKPVVVGGDGRSDSPGHCAKYGSYSLLELNVNLSISIPHLFQSNEEGVNHSVNMEKEGLIRCVRYLETEDVTISKIVTDRHVQINKWLRENLPDTDHRFDVWHLAKSLKKKVDKASKEKNCGILEEWRRSIINHLYWCAATTPDGDPNMMLAKWLSLDNHMHNKHKGHGRVYPKCGHGRIVGRQKGTKWLEQGSAASAKAGNIIDNAYFKPAVKKMSPGEQTSSIEAYHSLILHFAPKMTAFSFKGMLCRLLLSALHYNENGDREQATTEDGKLRWSVTFIKSKKGGYSVRPIKDDSSHGYVDKLMVEVQRRCRENDFDFEDNNIYIPPALCSSYDHPNKAEAVDSYNERHKRYSKSCYIQPSRKSTR